MDARTYWMAVAEQRRAIQEAFPTGQVFITSLHNPLHGMVGDRVFEVTVENAARMLVGAGGRASHRLSTKEEIKRFHEETDQRARDCAAEELRKKSSTLVISEQQAVAAGIMQSPTASAKRS